MKPVKCCLFFAMFSSLLISCSAGVGNLSDAKDKIRQYYSSGQYEADVLKETSSAWNKMKNGVIGPKTAAIFDIDETALNSYAYMDSIDFGYVPPLWDKWLEQSGAKAIKGTLALQDSLKSRGVRIIFLSGREGVHFGSSMHNLKSEGFRPDSLILREPGEMKLSAAQYKLNHRKSMALKYDIIANVGDQESDFYGGFSGQEVHIPNPLYRVN